MSMQVQYNVSGNDSAVRRGSYGHKNRRQRGNSAGSHGYGYHGEQWDKASMGGSPPVSPSANWAPSLYSHGKPNSPQQQPLPPPPQRFEPSRQEMPPMPAMPTVAPMPPVSPAPSNRPSARVNVHVYGLPNNLCNTMCMEAVIEQAGLEEFVISCEAWPGNSHGEATIQLVTRDAGEQCLRHFHGCRWCSSGTVVAAEMGHSSPGAWTDAPLDGIVTPPPEPSHWRSQADFAQDNRVPMGSSSSDGSIDGICISTSGALKKPSPMSSPTMSATSTMPPPSPSFSSKSIRSLTNSPLHTHIRSDAYLRKVSWADMDSEDEGGEEKETSIEENCVTDSGSAGVSTSDDGF